MMTRDILHVHIADFPTKLAQTINTSLRNKPVAIAPTHSDRAVIQSVSPEARAEGIHEGTPVFKGRQLCSSLVVLPPNPRLVSSGSRALVKITREYSPLWEPVSPGQVFLDLTGSRRMFGPGRDAALHLGRELGERLSLTGSVGVSDNKLISRIASGYLEEPGVYDVVRGDEEGFIAPLPVSVLPGIGTHREQILLSDLNLRLVGEVAALTIPQLSLPFGPFAHLLHQRARGIDPSPVLPPRRTPDIQEETYLPVEENNDHILTAHLYRMAEGCGARLRRTVRYAASLTLSISFADGVNSKASKPLSPPSNGDLSIFTVAHELFSRACEKRVKVRWMKLRCGRLTAERQQLELFEMEQNGFSGKEGLQAAMDSVRERYGMEAVRWGRAFLSKN